MGTKETERLLRQELEKERPDRQTVMDLMARLEEEDRAEMSGKAPDEAEASWIRFQLKRDKRRMPRWFGAAAIAAVFCLMIFAAPPAFGASNFCDLLGRWTESVFVFETTVQTTVETEALPTFDTDHPGLRQIYNEAVNLGITQPVIPTWVPDGYELSEIKTSTVKDGVSLHALLNNGNKNINIAVLIRSDSVATSYSKDENEAYWVELNGIAHYVVSNDGKQMVVWKTGNLECRISASDESIDVIKILKTVYR